MRGVLLICLAALTGSPVLAADWQVRKIPAPARVMAIDASGGARVNAGGLWYRLSWRGDRPALSFIEKAPQAEVPENALPHGRVAVGMRDIARVWLAEPTSRYEHGILGDKITAVSLTIETRDGKEHIVRLKDDAVFEDLTPRLADLDGDGHDEVVVVKSYLKRGSALAVIGRRDGRYEIITETPPLGSANRWLNPAGIADFDGDGKTDIALVRQPHVVGQLEIWTWNERRLSKTAELADTSNHIIGSRALSMSVVADFDGDGIADLAVPSLDRSRLRIISFAGETREIASMALPAKVVTDLALVRNDRGQPAVVAGLRDGSLVWIRAAP